MGNEQDIHAPETYMHRLVLILLTMLSAICSGCSEQAGDSSQHTAAERGRMIYVSNCIPCHNDAPALPGALGPAIVGSSPELVAARVLHAAYPQGYTPKRPSRAMPALPHLKDEVDNLAAYLKAAETR